MRRVWQDTKGSEDTLSFSLSPCDSRVSCLSQRVEVVLVLGFLQAQWGSTAALCCSALKKTFALVEQSLPLPPNWGVYPQHFINTRWSHCLFGFQGKKKRVLTWWSLSFVSSGQTLKAILNFICSATYRVHCRCWVSLQTARSAAKHLKDTLG